MPSKITIAALLVSLFGALSACAGETRIPPGDTFLLGGDQNQPILVEGQNTGSVDIIVEQQDETGRTETTRLKPGARIEEILPAETVLRLVNTSPSKTARAKFKLTEEVGALAMRYEDR